jgi:hypothetical protein
MPIKSSDSWQKSLAACVVLILAACGSSIEKMDDHDLRQKVYECENASDPTTVDVQSCRNYRRECERRKSAGHYVC